MKTIKLNSALLCSALLLAFSLPVHASSSQVSGTVTSNPVNVNVTVPEFIILHYYSSLDLTFATDSQALDEGTNTMNVGWDDSIEGNSPIVATQDADTELDVNSTVTVSIPDVWAVRGFAPNGKATVTINSNATQLTKQNTSGATLSTIGVSDVGVTDESNVSSGTSIDVTLNGIAKSTASKGGVTMGLNFANTTQSGAHTGAVYTITATAI